MSSGWMLSCLRSLRDATRHRRLKPPPVERFPVPPGLVSLESEQGQQWAKEASLDVKLMQSVQQQDHPAFCAVACAMTLTRAVEVGITNQFHFPDVFREVSSWPPVFKHYGWDALDALPGVLKYRLLRHLQYDGAPLALIAEWFRVQNYSAQVISAGEVEMDTFRNDVQGTFSLEEAALPSAARHYLLVNYSRTAVGQRMFSGGHYAPLGGYHRPLDKVLLLEVNSRRYPSVWVDLPCLWGALHTRVGNGSWRGYMRVSGPEAKAFTAG